MTDSSLATLKVLLVIGAAVIGAFAAILGLWPTVLVGAAFIAVIWRLLRTKHQAAPAGLGTLAVSVSGLIILLVVLNQTVPPGVSATSRILGMAIIIVGFVPFIVWTQRWELPVPLFPAVCGIYVIYFGAPVFLTNRYGALSRVVPKESIVPAEWMALFGLVAMEVGYYWTATRKGTRRTAKEWSPRPNDDPETLWLWLGVLGVVTYLVAAGVAVPAALAQPVTLLAALATLVGVELYTRWQNRTLTAQGAIFLLGILIPARVILGFGKGANFEALSVLIALGIAAATFSRKIPWPAVAAAILALAILQPIKLAFRETPAYRTQHSPFSRVVGYARTARDYAAGEGEFQDARESFVVRYGFITTLAAVMEDSPDHIPYWAGKTYAPIFSKIFPRILLPWKAEEVTGQTFGHRYHLLYRYDTQTSYNMPILVEFYANFGPVGVVLGMFGMGLFYAWAQLFALRRVQAVLGTGAAIFILAQLAYIESALSFVISGFVYAVVLVYAVRFCARVIQSRRPQLAVRPEPVAVAAGP